MNYDPIPALAVYAVRYALGCKPDSVAAVDTRNGIRSLAIERAVRLDIVREIRGSTDDERWLRFADELEARDE